MNRQIHLRNFFNGMQQYVKETQGYHKEFPLQQLKFFLIKILGRQFEFISVKDVANT